MIFVPVGKGGRCHGRRVLSQWDRVCLGGVLLSWYERVYLAVYDLRLR